MTQDKDREAYEKWAFTPHTGPLWNFKDATWAAWQAAKAYYTGNKKV